MSLPAARYCHQVRPAPTCPKANAPSHVSAPYCCSALLPLGGVARASSHDHLVHVEHGEFVRRVGANCNPLRPPRSLGQARRMMRPKVDGVRLSSSWLQEWWTSRTKLLCGGLHLPLIDRAQGIASKGGKGHRWSLGAGAARYGTPDGRPTAAAWGEEAGRHPNKNRTTIEPESELRSAEQSAVRGWLRTSDRRPTSAQSGASGRGGVGSHNTSHLIQIA